VDVSYTRLLKAVIDGCAEFTTTEKDHTQIRVEVAVLNMACSKCLITLITQISALFSLQKPTVYKYLPN